jgi:hypothetical protein
MKRFDRRQLGRDPAMGRVAFKTGAVLTRKDKLRHRKSKVAKEWLRRQISSQD